MVVQRCEPAPATSCGFGEMDDPYAGSYWAESEQEANAGKKVRANAAPRTSTHTLHPQRGAHTLRSTALGGCTEPCTVT